MAKKTARIRLMLEYAYGHIFTAEIKKTTRVEVTKSIFVGICVAACSILATRPFDYDFDRRLCSYTPIHLPAFSRPYLRNDFNLVFILKI